MSIYDRYMNVVVEDGVEVFVPGARDPFRLLVDDNARRLAIARIGCVGVVRGHRNLIKAVSEEYETDVAEENIEVARQH